MKLTPLTGIVIAIVILGVVAGVMAQVSIYVNSADLTSFGVYGGYIKGFVSGTPVLMFITLIYNIFMFVVRTQQAKLKDFTEAYDTTKLVITATEFVGMIGPIFALAPSAEWKAVGSIASFIILVTANEISHIWKNLTPTSLQPTLPEPEPEPAPEPQPIVETVLLTAASADVYGNVSPSGTWSWPKGTEVRIMADPEIDCEFDFWEIDGARTSMTAYFRTIADAKHTFIAHFKKCV